MEASAESLTGNDEADKDASELKGEQKSVVIKKIARQIPLKVDESSDIKSVIKAFALMVAIQGPSVPTTQDNKYTGNVGGGSLVLPTGEPPQS